MIQEEEHFERDSTGAARLVRYPDVTEKYITDAAELPFQKAFHKCGLVGFAALERPGLSTASMPTRILTISVRVMVGRA